MADDSTTPQGENDEEWWNRLRRESLWEGIGDSLLASAGGAIFFFTLTWWEGSEAALPGPWFVLYCLGGKWLVGGICWAIGLFGLVHSIYRYCFTNSV